MNEKIIMKVVKELLTRAKEESAMCTALSDLGIEMDFFGNYEILDAALDLLGLPSDNTTDYEYGEDNDEIFCRDAYIDDFDSMEPDEYITHILNEVEILKEAGFTQE
jgi:hypothetical protein